MLTPPLFTDTEKRQYLLNHGWDTWYHPDYWVHPAVIATPDSQDFTNYGMSLDTAFMWQWNQLGPVRQKFGIPSLNITAYIADLEQA